MSPTAETICHGSELAQFYANKNVLITGASGYLGKLAVQKLLRTCPDVKGIYIILREKEGMSVKDRWNCILENVVFKALKKEVPDIQKKIHIFSGDLQLDGLGLNPDDRQRFINEIDVVIHSGASVNFEEDMKIAINTNIKGTKELLNLCEEMKNLVSVMITSTAYSFCVHKEVGECFMKPPIASDTIIKMAETVDAELLNKLAPKLIENWPNTYTYTKAIMEDVVNSRRLKLPVGMYRPSIVISTYKDPLKCWTDNLNGPTALSLGITLGAVHAIYCDKHAVADVVPADYCVNGLLAATYDVYKKYKKEVMPNNIVYNYVATKKYFFSFEQVGYIGTTSMVPLRSQVWAPSYILTKCPVIYAVLSFFLHYLPALVMDGIQIIKGKKARFVKLYNKMSHTSVVLRRFMLESWDFQNKNIVDLWNNMNQEDKILFPFDMSTLDWNDYFKSFFWGLKEYILKEKMDEENIKADMRKQKRMKKYHQITVCTFYLLCAVIIWKIFIYLKSFLF